MKSGAATAVSVQIAMYGMKRYVVRKAYAKESEEPTASTKLYGLSSQTSKV
jgi:hypothetical protein